jgi:hypothetical protein
MMRIPFGPARVLLAIALGAALPQPTWAQVGKAQTAGAADRHRNQRSDCSRVELSPRPGWTNSGVWDGENLVLVDTVAGKLLRYAPSGKALGEAPLTGARTLEAAFPSRIAAQNGHVVVQVGPSGFMNLGPGLSFQGAVDAGERGRAADGATLRKLLTWAPAGNDILGFAEVEAPNERWSAGVVRFSVQDSRDFHYPKDLSIKASSREFHRLGYHYTDAIGSTGYVLLMEDGFQLYRSEPGSDGLEEVKALGSWSVPELPVFSQPEDFAAVMGVVEESAMPAGLYAWNKDLYLLSRRPAGGSTEWRLSRIDLVRGRLAETTIIPSRAHHLFAIPGNDKWAFVEKGVARGLREQDVNAVLLVPSILIQHPRQILCQ